MHRQLEAAQLFGHGQIQGSGRDCSSQIRGSELIQNGLGRHGCTRTGTGQVVYVGLEDKLGRPAEEVEVGEPSQDDQGNKEDPKGGEGDHPSGSDGDGDSSGGGAPDDGDVGSAEDKEESPGGRVPWMTMRA